MTAKLVPLGYVAAAVLLACGVGIATVSSTRLALVAVILTILVVIAAQVAEWPSTTVLAGLLVLSAMLVDLPGKAHFGRFTANAALTIGYAICLAIVIGASARVFSHHTRRIVTPLLVFLVMAGLSLMWTSASISAAQNLLVFWIFVASIIVGTWLPRSIVRLESVERWITCCSLITLALYAVSLGLGGLGSGAIFGNRSFALVGVMIVAWGAAGWRYRRRFGLSLAVCASLLILASLSRTAFVTAVIVCCVAWLEPRRFHGWLRLFGAAATAGALVYLAVEKFAALHHRIFTGDVQSVGGISINLEGRGQLWGTAWRSFLSSPIFGHGVGSADHLIQQLYPSAGHPHNDYLRLLNDYGVVGTALWVAGVAVIGRSCWRAWHSAPEDGVPTGGQFHPLVRRIHATAALSLLGVLLGMVTDNVIDYEFVMAPLGLLLGLSIGLANGAFQPESIHSRLHSITVGSASLTQQAVWSGGSEKRRHDT